MIIEILCDDVVHYRRTEATEDTKRAKVKMLDQIDEDRYNGVDPDRFNEYGIM